MKKTKIFASALWLLLLSSCTGGMAKKAGGNITGSENNAITFKVNGNTIKTDGWNISRLNTGQGLNLNITTNMHSDKRTVMVNLRGCSPGTYSLDADASGELSGYGDYKPNYNDMLKSYRFEQGRFTIESIDTAKGLLNASFFGTVRSGDVVMQITDGRIVNGALDKTVPTY